jgi:hypothetical protein
MSEDQYFGRTLFGRRTIEPEGGRKEVVFGPGTEYEERVILVSVGNRENPEDLRTN